MRMINRKLMLVGTSVAGKRAKGNIIREATYLKCSAKLYDGHIVVNLSTGECILAQAPYLVAD